MNEIFCTNRGVAVGIGTINILKMKINSKVLPVFSFIVLKGNKEEGELFIATCIDLRIDGYGNSELNAIENMNKNVFCFLLDNFTNPKCRNNAWSNLEKLARFDDWSKELWNIYKAIQYKFAEKNKSLYGMSFLTEKEKQKIQYGSAYKEKKNTSHPLAKPSEIKKEKRDIVFISSQGAKFTNIEFNPSIKIEDNISHDYSSVKNMLQLGAMLGQMAILKNMKISPWLQQPVEGKKRCIQPLQL